MDRSKCQGARTDGVTGSDKAVAPPPKSRPTSTNINKIVHQSQLMCRPKPSSMASTIRVPIASLPLPASIDRLCHNLIPDPVTPSVSAFRKETLGERSSLQRRARIIPPLAHFSYVVPLPLPFPYRIPPPENSGDKEAVVKNIESWLNQHEPLTAVPKARPTIDATDFDNSLQKLSANDRNNHIHKRHLLALSESCLRDCLPNLDVGDANETNSQPSNDYDADTERRETARQELIDILSGHTTLMTPSDVESPAYAPWSLRYCGHQFGVWAGQLGDGRAISISGRDAQIFMCEEIYLT